MAEIAQFLGHENDRITQRVYARCSPMHLQKAAAALELDIEPKQIEKNLGASKKRANLQKSWWAR